VLAAKGEDASAHYSVMAAGAVYGQGVLTAGEQVHLDDLYMGNYIVTINMDPDVMLTSLNGYPSMQRYTAQWLATISGGKTSLYEIELSRTGTVSGTLVDMKEAAAISFRGSELYDLTATDSYSQSGMIPDTYTVTIVLPEGRYTGEGWSFVESAGQILAITQAVVSGGTETVLPAITSEVYGTASGTVMDTNRAPLSGVTVCIFNAAGEEVASTQSDDEGLWQIKGLSEGNYTARYEAGSSAMIPASAFVISEATLTPRMTALQAIPASLKVQVFVDDNNNGVWGKNEPFLPDAELQLLKSVGGEMTVIASAKTDRDGVAELIAPAGTYTLRCELPEDYGYAKKGTKDLISQSAMEQSSDRVQQLSGVILSVDAQREIGIGTQLMATLTGTIWLDLNCDGLWQSEEPGVEGMRVTAEGTKNGLMYETVSGTDGKYEIAQIRNGTYNVTYHVPDGYCFTVKANGAQQLRSKMTTEADRKGTDQIVFEKGETLDEQNIGLMQEAVIEGFCFLDANYNGYLDAGESGLPGVELELLRQSNSKRLQTAVSDTNGYFRFGNVRGDTFKIKALLPAGTTYTVSVPGDWSANQFAPREGRREQTVTGVEGVSGETLTLAIGAIRYGSVSGVAYEDANFTGDWETGEKIVQGLAVTLLNEAGDTVRTVKTNKNGSYTFDTLTPGQYRIRLTANAGYAFTKVTSGNVVDNLGGGKGESELFTVGLGQNLTGVDIGMIVPAAVKGVVFADANDNGHYDANEKGLKGTRVSLMTENGVVEAIKVKSDGAFEFDSVLPGRYYLRYELPENGVFSPRVSGGNAVVGEGSDGAGDWFNVNAGDVWTAPVCGGLDLGVISGYAFGDANGSGMKDETENTLAGMTLVLTPSRADLTEMTAVTGADGAFLFEALRPDTYTLTVKCPDGYVLSRMDNVTLGLAHGLAEQEIDLMVGMGNAWTDQALGCVLPASYAGRVWLDENVNGLCDAGEKPAAGEKLTLADQATGAVIANIVTDENGLFTVEGIAPGTYALTFKLAEDVHIAPDGETTFAEEGDMLVMRDIVIAEGTHEFGAQLGLVRETTVGGMVWLDSDGSTIAVKDAEVTLTDASGETTTVRTAADGKYAFAGLMPGEYRLSVELPENHAAIEPDDRRLEDGSLVSVLTSVAFNKGESDMISVRMAEHQLQLDMGSVLPGRLGDFCWLDLNGNGLQDGDEGGIPGVQITLVRNGSILAETVSDQYGYYIFEDLYPGEYILRAVWPAEVKPTQVRTDLTMIASVLGENGESVLVPVDSNGVNYDADLGFVLLDAERYPAGYGEGKTQNWVFEH